jgi:phosphoribosylformimino-5-aminoimidazole carboxamide ribotide isomerase
MFRPCIDLHDGKVKQIIGGTLTDSTSPATNFVSEKPSTWFAQQYKKDQLTGGHIIRLGKGNEQASLEALRAYPSGMQIGGGMNNENSAEYLAAGASHIIVTSFVFKDGRLNQKNLDLMVKETGKEKLVLDLSCRIRDDKYWIVTDRWQKFTNVELNKQTIKELEGYCDEFLIHAVDVEGLCNGIDWQLVDLLSNCSIPTTYAGGAGSLSDLEKITRLTENKIDLTIGSALDIFGGSLIKYQDAVEFNKKIQL